MRVSRWAVASVVLVLSVVIDIADAAPIAGGRIALHAAPTRLIDTRAPVGAPPVTSLAIGSGILNVSLTSLVTHGEATLRPCGAPAGPEDIVVPFRAGDHPSVRVLASVGFCLASTTPVHVVVDSYGFVHSTPMPGGLQYVELGAPVTLLDTDVASPLIPASTVDLGRPAALLADTAAAVVSIDVVSDDNGWASVHPCSLPAMQADLAFRQAAPVIIALSKVTPTDSLCLTYAGSASIIVELIGRLVSAGEDPTAVPPMWSLRRAQVPAPGLFAFNPGRVLDTRNAIGWSDTSPILAGEVVELEFDPSLVALSTAVTMNVTVVSPLAAGYLTVWPCDQSRPETSSHNFAARQVVANLVVAKLSPTGSVCFRSTSTTHLLVDVTATYDIRFGSLAKPITPTRLLDTRNAIGVPGSAPVADGSQIAVQIAGRGTVPADADAVTMNVTATGASSDGFVTVWPCDEPRPEASNLNFVAGRDVPNLVTSQLSLNGTVCLFTSARAHLLADVGAWYGADGTSGLIDLPPDRLLDTRNAIGVPGRQPLPAAQPLTLQVAGRGGVAPRATAVVMNVTITNPGGSGYATVWPCDRPQPDASNLNFTAGATVPNLAMVQLAADGTVCLFATQTTHLLADVAGYLTQDRQPGLSLELR